MWRFWVTLCKSNGNIVTAEIEAPKELYPDEIQARRYIVSSTLESGGRVLKIENAGIQLE